MSACHATKWDYNSIMAVEDILHDIDEYIKRCPDPDTPYYPTEDGIILNIRQVRDEIARGTLVGQEAATSWQGMRDAEKGMKNTVHES